MYQLDSFFQTTIPYSSNTHNYLLLQKLTFLVFPFLTILTSNLASLLLLNQLPRGWVFCTISSTFFPPTDANCIQGPCPSLYGVCITHMGGSTHTALMDRAESKVLRLIGCPHLTNCLLPLKSCRTVASLSIFYHYFHAHCSSELAASMPPPPPPASPNSTFLFCSSLFYSNPLCKSQPVSSFLHPFHWSALEPPS